jgi:hypothetical protein
LRHRRPTSPGEILNCDLTEANGTNLDSNNLNHFIESSLTDFYLRFDVENNNVDRFNVERNNVERQRGTFRFLPNLKRRQLEPDEETKEICKRFSSWEMFYFCLFSSNNFFFSKEGKSGILFWAFECLPSKAYVKKYLCCR